MKLLALDFDGVISDSAREAFAVATRTHADLSDDSPFGGREGDAALYDSFVALMPLGNRAEDYYAALEAIRREQDLPDQSAYDAFKASLDDAVQRDFHRRFYEVRAAWAERDPEGWRAAMAPYPGICETLRAMAAGVSLAIATAKDRGSVRKLLDAYAIADLFADDRVHDKDTGVHKHAHIQALAAATGLPAREITFVDDKVNHLHDVATTGARCALAGWGYNGAREHREARQAGFLVLTLPGLAEELG